MSDAAVATIVSGAITIVGLLVGFLTLWVKLRYGTQMAEQAATKAALVEGKIDSNNTMTEQIRDATAEHVNGCHNIIDILTKTVQEHGNRIGKLEGQMVALHANIEVVSKGVDSTRHELRGHLQTITNKLDVLSIGAALKKEDK